MIQRLLFLVPLFLSSSVRAADPEPDFARDVRPILAQFCFKCHGQDEKTRKAKLRLDDRAAALEKGAFSPGKPAESELVARIRSGDPDQVMPPPATKRTLSATQKQILERWITAGAEYQAHWAFVAPKRGELPKSSTPSPAKNTIDAYILARLEQEKLKFSPEATRETLIRRVSLDLIGLPPSPEDVDAFLKDTAPDAYEKLVERLLASPRYGERWARRWLDLARYADTNGYEKDRPRSIWPYRDWVINALNQDLPFDQFTIRQIAGDMLPNATTTDRIATGFHRNTMLNEEGGIDPLEFRYHAVADRVATTGTAWLGLTLGCAQCHSHKYDPVPQRDYYRLFALLNNADEPDLDVPTPEVIAKRQEIESKLAKLLAGLPDQLPKVLEVDLAFAEWLAAERKKTVLWKVVKPTAMKSNLPLLTMQPDDSIFVSGDTSKRDVYELVFRGDFRNVTAIRLEALPDDRLPKHGPGRVYYEGPQGDCHLSTLTATANGQPVTFSKASQTVGSAATAIDTNPQTGWSVNGGQGQRQVAVFRFEKPLTTTELKLEMVFEKYYAAGLGRFRIAVTSGENATASDASPEIEALLRMPDAKLSPDAQDRLRQRFFQTTPFLAEARKPIDALRKQLPALPTTLVLQERPPENPRPTFIHHRGEFLQAGEKVEPGTPAFLPPMPPGATANRLAFARWLVARDNPLTARVAVNRQWQAFFGRGLVRTAEDFGTQGELPTHPELLDWLAVEFMESGWSMKRLHRLIVTSATYRQSSTVTPELKERDAENRWLARGPRVRLEAEIVRDSALKVAGLLSPKMGGPSVFPPQPASVTTEGTYGPLQWKASEGEDRYRRSLYTFAKRTAPFALYATFDAPSGEVCVARRDSSNTPLHALFLMNDPIFLEAAQAIGKDLAARQGPVAEKVKTLFRRITARQPTEKERTVLADYFESELKRFEAKELDPVKIAGPGSGDPVERAAWTSLARVLLNLDEFVTKK